MDSETIKIVSTSGIYDKTNASDKILSLTNTPMEPLALSNVVHIGASSRMPANTYTFTTMGPKYKITMGGCPVSHVSGISSSKPYSIGKDATFSGCSFNCY